MCKQLWSRTAVVIGFLFYCLTCMTEGNNRLQKRLNVLENRYDVDRVQYRSDLQELWSQMQNVEELFNASKTDEVPTDEKVQQLSTGFTIYTINEITDQIHQTIKGFQTGLKSEKLYMRKENELFKHTVKAEHEELTNTLDEFKSKIENELIKIESSMATMAVNLSDVLENTESLCRATIQAMDIEQTLQLDMKEMRNIVDNETENMKAIVFNIENKTNMKLDEVEDGLFGKLHEIEENIEHKLAEIEKTTYCTGGWIRHGSFCYYFNREKLTWQSARDRCKALGGYLAEPIEDSDFMFLYVMFRQTDFWMGGSDIMSDGYWIWDHRGTTVSKQNGFWGKGQPDGRQNEDCLQWIEKYQAWTDRDCTLSFRYICQR